MLKIVDGGGGGAVADGVTVVLKIEVVVSGTTGPPPTGVLELLVAVDVDGLEEVVVADVELVTLLLVEEGRVLVVEIWTLVVEGLLVVELCVVVVVDGGWELELEPPAPPPELPFDLQVKEPTTTSFVLSKAGCAEVNGTPAMPVPLAYRWPVQVIE